MRESSKRKDQEPERGRRSGSEKRVEFRKGSQGLKRGESDRERQELESEGRVPELVLYL